MSRTKAPLYRCPVCQTTGTFKTLRVRQYADRFWRQRQCKSCGTKFSTIEKALVSIDPLSIATISAESIELEAITAMIEATVNSHPKGAEEP